MHVHVCMPGMCTYVCVQQDTARSDHVRVTGWHWRADLQRQCQAGT